MDLERKKELLRLVDSMGKDVNNDNCGNYIPRVINAVEIGMKYNDKDKFKTALEGMKKTSFGGNAERQGYFNFVDNIIKKREYRIDSLNFEELMFVFSWLRRVVKTKEAKKKDNSGGYNKNESYDKRSYSYDNRHKYNNKQMQNGKNRKQYDSDHNYNVAGRYNSKYNNQNTGKNKSQIISNNESVNDNPFASLAALKDKLQNK